MSEERICGAYIIATYGNGRNTRHKRFDFCTRESAKEYGKKYLDSNDSVSRYTIYDN